MESGGAGSARACRLGLLLVLALVALVRIRLLDLPLERDEGDYAYFGMLFAEGESPASDEVRLRFPLTSLVYAGVAELFGYTAAGIHGGLLLVNLLSILFLYRIGARLLGEGGGLAAAFLFAVLDLSPAVRGLSFNREQLILVLVLPAFALLLGAAGVGARRGARCFGGGLLLGLAFLVKQPAALFVPFGALLVAAAYRPHPQGRASRIDWRALARGAVLFGAGVAAPYLIVVATFAALGALERFVERTIQDPKERALSVPPRLGFGRAKEVFGAIVAAAPGIWLLSGAGLVAACGGLCGPFGRAVRGRNATLVLFAACSALAVVPGFHFRPHYFALLLPAAALLAAAAAAAAARLAGRVIPGATPRRAVWLAAALVLGSGAGALWVGRADFFQDEPLLVCRRTYGPNPFPEAVLVGRYLAQRSAPAERVLILGSEPEILFYARRRSVTSHVYMYPLTERGPRAAERTRELIRSAEAARPRFVVHVNAGASWTDTGWLGDARGAPVLFEWFERFRTDYRPVIRYETGPGAPRIVDDPALLARPPATPHHVVVLERLR